MADQGDKFECAIHLGPFEEPKLLDCHHTFCRKCLENLAGSNHLGNQSSIRCPLCTKISQVPVGGVTQFSNNFYITTQPSSSTWGRDDTEYCSKHPEDLLKCFCKDCNTIICLACLLGEHKNHKYLIIEDSKDTILKDYKYQKDKLTRKLDELKTVKEIGEESLKKIVEYRQTALNSYLTELQRNYDKNCEKLNTVLNEVNTKKSQIEITTDINPDDTTTRPIDILRAVLILKEINKEPSKLYFPPIQYYKFNKKEESEDGMNSVGRLESVTLSLPYTYRSNTWNQLLTNRVIRCLRAVPGQIGNCLTMVLPFCRESVRPVCGHICTCCLGCLRYTLYYGCCCCCCFACNINDIK